MHLLLTHYFTYANSVLKVNEKLGFQKLLTRCLVILGFEEQNLPPQNTRHVEFFFLGEGGNSCIKWTGVIIGKETYKRCQDPSGWLEVVFFFTSKRYQSRGEIKFHYIFGGQYH